MRYLLTLILLLASSSAIAEKKACMIEAEDYESISKVDELGCKKGDILTLWISSTRRKTMLGIRAGMMSVCDFSLPFQVQHAGSTGTGVQYATCTLSGEKLEVLFDKVSNRLIN